LSTSVKIIGRLRGLWSVQGLRVKNSRKKEKGPHGGGRGDVKNPKRAKKSSRGLLVVGVTEKLKCRRPDRRGGGLNGVKKEGRVKKQYCLDHRKAKALVAEGGR